MSEKLIGQAERTLLGNDLFWNFHKYDQEMPDLFIRLKWIGYNDHDWWMKWSKGTEVKEQNGRKFRIDYSNCNVYELVGDDDA